MKIFDEFGKVEDALEEVDVPSNHFDTPGDFVEKMKGYKVVFIAILLFVKIFTRKKGDAKIDQLISGINMFL